MVWLRCWSIGCLVVVVVFVASDGSLFWCCCWFYLLLASSLLPPSRVLFEEGQRMLEKSMMGGVGWTTPLQIDLSIRSYRMMSILVGGTVPYFHFPVYLFFAFHSCFCVRANFFVLLSKLQKHQP